MPRGKPRGRRETGDVVKWQIIELWEAGLKNKSEIARRLHLSWTAVNLWVQRWESEGHLNVRPRSGRPRTTSGDDETTVNTYTAFYGTSGTPKPVQVKLEQHERVPSFASAAAAVAAATAAANNAGNGLAPQNNHSNGPLALLPLKQLSDPGPGCYATHSGYTSLKRGFENGATDHAIHEDRGVETVGLDPPPPQRLSLATQTEVSEVVG